MLSFHIGTNGWGLESHLFKKTLMECGVSHVIDVRRWITSKFKPDFSRSSLSRYLPGYSSTCDVAYTHERELSPPQELLAWRKEQVQSVRSKKAREAMMLELWPEYEVRFIEHSQGIKFQEALWRVADMIRGGILLCLMCTESETPDVLRCHRLIIAEQLSELTGCQWAYIEPPRRPERARKIIPASTSKLF